MEDRAIALYEPQRPVALAEWTQEDLDALKQTVAKGCDVPQFKVFIMAARRLGLDPFARQIVPITQGGGMTPQVTIDGLRLIAERTGKYGGQIGPQWCGKDGVWHDVWLEDGAPAAARVAVIRRDFEQPMWGVARYKSYAKGGNWTGMPDVMIAKVAESLALRKAFPQELSGVYSDDEMDQGNTGPTPEPTPRQQAQPQRPAPARATVTRAPADPAADARAMGQQQRTNGSMRKALDAKPAGDAFAALRLRAVKAGITSQEDWEAVCEEYAGATDPAKMTLPGKQALVTYVEQLEAAKAAAAAKVVDAANVDLADLPPVAMVP